jgi:hypothetical protein
MEPMAARQENDFISNVYIVHTYYTFSLSSGPSIFSSNFFFGSAAIASGDAGPGASEVECSSITIDII